MIKKRVGIHVRVPLFGMLRIAQPGTGIFDNVLGDRSVPRIHVEMVDELAMESVLLAMKKKAHRLGRARVVAENGV